MIIALDIDETYTEDTTLWDHFIRVAQNKGHEVIVVTMRHESELDDEYADRLKEQGLKIYCSARSQKREYMMSLEPKIFVDVWIDDCPEAICDGSGHHY